MGIKVISEFADPRFRQGSPSEHKLSVMWHPGGLCFHVTDTANTVSLAWKEWAGDSVDQLYALVAEDPLLSGASYASVCVATGTDAAALTPARLFDPSRAAEYWQSLSPLPAGHSVQADLLSALDAYLVYPVAGPISRSLPGARVVHAATAWLNGIYRYSLPEAGPAIFAHTLGQSLMVAAFENRALRFFNTFSFQTAQDFLYFVLLALHQAQFSLEQTPLLVSGKITADSEISMLLQRYFTDMQMLAPAAAGPYPAGIPDDRRHWYFDLACLGSL